MFDNLSDKLQSVFDKIKKNGTLTEENMKEVSKEIRLALLEADVNFKVVKEFIKDVEQKAIGQNIIKSLTPHQMLIKIVNDELVELFGGHVFEISLNNKPNIAMLVGLQGAGKTTTVGKLAQHLRKKESKKPLLVACDIYRLAAIDQLKTIGKELGIEVFEKGNQDPRITVKEAMTYAKENDFDYLIFDTAGRLHIDDTLMNELKDLVDILKPHEILLVIDAMIGQDAVNVANAFNEALPLSGVILTKLDGDTRGGAALSITHITKLPIKFVGTSEKMSGLDVFYPDRMASRILGMGDVLSLVDKVSAEINEKDAEDAMKKMQAGKFDLDDFLKQLNQIKKMGPLGDLLKLIPGAKKMGLGDLKIDPKQMTHVEAIILSMTLEERKNPDILKHSRKQRISKGCGLSVVEINKLLKQFEEMKKMMKMMKNGQMPNFGNKR